jgi:hypothetical protein
MFPSETLVSTYKSFGKSKCMPVGEPMLEERLAK